LSQQLKVAYETNLEKQFSGETITSNQVRLRELPVHRGVERRCTPAQSGVLQRDLRFTGLYGRSLRLRA
jgi:hypothetical protein